jgi:hypothetical protein
MEFIPESALNISWMWRAYEPHHFLEINTDAVRSSAHQLDLLHHSLVIIDVMKQKWN